MQSFEYVHHALRIHQGLDSLQELARELDRLACRRAVLLCGASLARAGELPALVANVLGDRCAGVHAGVVAHSPVASVQAAARVLADLRADAVIALGGGSAVVTARAASILLAEGGTLQALCTRRLADGKLASPRLLAPKLPQFIVPTTPTTACPKAGAAVFDPSSGERLALFDPRVRPRAICIHPRALASAPASLVRTASLNTLAMALEGLESDTGHSLSDAPLLQALRLLVEYLPALSADDAVTDGDVETRSQLALAALLCGQGTDATGGGLASVLGHAVGARFQLDNGLVNAVVLPHTMRFNLPATESRLVRVAPALTAGKNAHAVIAGVESLLQRMMLPRRLRDLGVPQDALADLAERAMDDWFVTRNPRRVDGPAAVLGILEAAW